MADENIQPVTEDKAEVPTAPVVAPKSRPRRRRKAATEENVSSDEASVSPTTPETGLQKSNATPDANTMPETSQPEQAQTPEKPKRRRGRPRKKPVETSTEAAENAAPADTDTMTAVTLARTTASAIPMEAPATTLAEADARASRDAQDVQSESAQDSNDSESKKDASQESEQQADQQQTGEGRRRHHRGHASQENRQVAQQRQGQQNQRSGRGQRKRGRHGQQEPQEPSLSHDELAAMKVAELRTKAAELGIDYVGVRKHALVDAVYAAAAAAEGFKHVSGVLQLHNEGYGFLRTGNYMEGDDDAFVSQQIVRQYGLRPGDLVEGTTAPARTGKGFPPISKVELINGAAPEQMRTRPRFRDLTPIYPNERLVMEHGKNSITGRAIDLVAPIGKGQRGLIVSPPKAGKTTILKKICQSIAVNNPEVHLFCLLVDERPEEVTDMERSIKGTVVASTFDMPAENHTAVSELVIEHAKRLVELGEDVVVVLDSITRLARAYNLAQPASGRILSGGVDSAALYPPKKFLGAARNIEGGGSLTILASALVDTGSKMDEVIFEEFKGTGNMELKLDRDLADRRIYPAIDPVASGTRNEELLIDAELQPFVWGIRRILANMNNTERAANALVNGLKQTKDNQEFLIRSARKAQQSEYFAG